MASKTKDKKEQKNIKLKVFNFMVPDELFETLKIIEYARAKKDIYNDIFEYYKKCVEKDYNNKNGLEIAKMLEGKFGRHEIIVYLNEEQTNDLERFAESKSLDLKDLYYNIVINFLRNKGKNISKELRNEWRQLVNLKDKIDKIYNES